MSEAGGPNLNLSRDVIVAKRVVEELRAGGYELAADCRVFFSVAALFGTQMPHADSRPGVRFGGTLVGGSRAVAFSSVPFGSPEPPPLAFDEDDVYFCCTKIRGCIWAALLRERRKVKKRAGSGGEEGGEKGGEDGSRESQGSGSGGGSGGSEADLRQLYNLVFGGPILKHGGEPSACPGVSIIFLLDVTPPPPVEARGADLSAEIERAAEAAEVPVSGLQSLVNKAQHWQQFDSAVVAQMTKAKAESRTTKPPKPIEAADLGDKILAIANGRPRTETNSLYQAVRNPRKTITIEMVQQHFKYPIKEAANRLGVCDETLRRVCRKHQMSWPTKAIPSSQPAVRNPKITIEMVQQHFKYTCKEAANRMGVCEETLRRVCRNHQIPRWPKKTITIEQAVRNPKITIEMVQQHFKYPIKEAADRMGVCERTLRRLCRKHQIPRWPKPPGKGPG